MFDERKWWVKEHWPTTIVPARYGGCYEGGEWIAFAVSHYALTNDDIYAYYDGGDIECMEWWDQNRGEWWVAVGGSPQAAFDRLVVKASTFAVGELDEQGE